MLNIILHSVMQTTLNYSDIFKILFNIYYVYI